MSDSLRLYGDVQILVGTIESRLSEVQEALVRSDTTEAHMKIAFVKIAMVIMLVTLALCRTFPGSVLHI